MSAAIPITRLDHTASELRSFAGKCGDGAQVRRLLALALVLEGRSRIEAAKQNGMDRQTLSDWVHRYNATGVDGLKSCHPPGAAPLLNEAQKAELKALVVKGPDPEKDTVIRWRCLDLQVEIARRFSVRVHESTVGKWLRQFGLTRLQPRPCHPKTDHAAQETFKKRARIGSPPVAVETGRAILDRRGAAEKFLVDVTP
jgi:transposase